LKAGAFKLVYNGIGGTGTGGSGGLRERILGQFSGGDGTGSLAMRKSSLNDLTKWRYSWVSFADAINHDADSKEPYSKERAEAIEVTWRLEYGWPILCRR